MHIADFYDMWLSDKKQLWSNWQKLVTTQAQLEIEVDCRRNSKILVPVQINIMGKIYTRNYTLYRSFAACIVLALVIRLLFSSSGMTLNPIEVESANLFTIQTVHINKKMALGDSATETSRTSKAGIYFYGAGTLSDTSQNG